MASPQAQILSERSPNTSATGSLSPKKGGNYKMEGKDMGLDENVARDVKGVNGSQPQKNSQQYYISPSDALQSPTTKKLSDLKAKKIGGAKGLKGKSLFQGIVGRNNAGGLGSGAFGEK